MMSLTEEELAYYEMMETDILIRLLKASGIDSSGWTRYNMMRKLAQIYREEVLCLNESSSPEEPGTSDPSSAHDS